MCLDFILSSSWGQGSLFVCFLKQVFTEAPSAGGGWWEQTTDSLADCYLSVILNGEDFLHVTYGLGIQKCPNRMVPCLPFKFHEFQASGYIEFSVYGFCILWCRTWILSCKWYQFGILISVRWHFLNLFFYWRIIALQNFVVFCQTLTWINHRYTIYPPFLKLPPISHPIWPL